MESENCAMSSEIGSGQAVRYVPPKSYTDILQRELETAKWGLAAHQLRVDALEKALKLIAANPAIEEIYQLNQGKGCL